jgi:hypothetical protein
MLKPFFDPDDDGEPTTRVVATEHLGNSAPGAQVAD